jgi:hypothetical protein
MNTHRALSKENENTEKEAPDAHKSTKESIKLLCFEGTLIVSDKLESTSDF